MGTKAKIAGIVIGGFIFLMIIGALGAGGGVSEASKYEGLTEAQTRSIKLIAEACDNKVMEAEVLAGEERAKLVQEQCDRAVDNRIEEYRAKNTSTSTEP